MIVEEKGVINNKRKEVIGNFKDIVILIKVQKEIKDEGIDDDEKDIVSINFVEVSIYTDDFDGVIPVYDDFIDVDTNYCYDMKKSKIKECINKFKVIYHLKLKRSETIFFKMIHNRSFISSCKYILTIERYFYHIVNFLNSVLFNSDQLK